MNKETILEIWNIEIEQEKLNILNIKYPNLKSEYTTQKMLFGFNMGSNKAKKYYE